MAAGIVIIVYSIFSLTSITAGASVVGSIPIGEKDEGYSPFDIAINQATNTVYVTSPDSGTIAVIEGSTNNLTDTISVGFRPVEIAVNPNTNLVYVGETSTGTISVINGSTNTILGTLKITDDSEFDAIGGIAVNEKTNKVYVLANNIRADPNYASLSIIDGLTNQVEQTFKVADIRWDYDVVDRARGIAVNSKTNTIYVTLFFGSLYVIDGSNNMVLTSLAVGKAPTEVEVNEETNRVYISDFGSGLLFVLDGLTNRVVDTIWIGHDPQGIAIDTVTNTIYVAGPDVVTINGSSHQVENRVEIGEYPNGIALNQNNGLVYVTRWVSDSIIVLELNAGNGKGSAMALSPLRQHTTSGNYTVELGWEFGNENDVTLILSFFGSSGIPLDYMQYDLVVRNASNGEVVQQFINQTMFFVGSHDMTFEKGDNSQIDVIIKDEYMEPIPNENVTFDIVIVPEFSSSIVIVILMVASIAGTVIWSRWNTLQWKTR